MEAVQAISITGEKSQEELELEAMRGEKVADDWTKDPRFHKMTLPNGRVIPGAQGADPEKGIEAENAPGSFEALMGGWASGRGKSFITEGH